MWTVISSEVKEDKKVLPVSLLSSFQLNVKLVPSFSFFSYWELIFLLFPQAAKSDESEDGGETEPGEDGEEGEKDKEETEKEEEKKTEPPLEDDAKKHGFLILSREDSTMVKTHIYAF